MTNIGFFFLYFSSKNAGIRAGDYIIGIHDNDVRWLKHSQVIDKIRSCPNYLKLTLVKVTPISNYLTSSYTKEILAKQENNEISGFDTTRLRKRLKKWNLLCSTSNILNTRELQANIERLRSIKLNFNTLNLSHKLKRSAMKLSIISYFNKTKEENQDNKEAHLDELLYKTL
jgi:hypothetical protein